MLEKFLVQFFNKKIKFRVNQKATHFHKWHYTNQPKINILTAKKAG